MTHLENHFERYLPVIESDLRTALMPPEDSPPNYYRMLHYHMGWVNELGQPTTAQTGKRIRPVICLLCCDSAAGDIGPARPAAGAVELVHNFSLLHDDIEDRSPTRRNRPTVWSIWGIAQAINAGDVLFTLAHLAIPRLAGEQADSYLVARSLRLLDETCLQLTQGQHLDLCFEDRETVTTGDYLNMIAGKTAALIAASAQLGALAAEVEHIRQSHYAEFGYHLGMAFQVLDDILDIWGDPAVTGKEAAIDIRQRKKSLPVLYALERSEELREIYASPAPFDEQTISHVISLLEGVSARDYAQALARSYSEKTIRSLENAAPGGAAGEALFELVDSLLHRDH